jgi:hypothetical protein
LALDAEVLSITAHAWHELEQPRIFDALLALEGRGIDVGTPAQERHALKQLVARIRRDHPTPIDRDDPQPAQEAGLVFGKRRRNLGRERGNLPGFSRASCLAIPCERS